MGRYIDVCRDLFVLHFGLNGEKPWNRRGLDERGRGGTGRPR